MMQETLSQEALKRSVTEFEGKGGGEVINDNNHRKRKEAEAEEEDICVKRVEMMV